MGFEELESLKGSESQNTLIGRRDTSWSMKPNDLIQVQCHQMLDERTAFELSAHIPATLQTKSSACSHVANARTHRQCVQPPSPLPPCHVLSTDRGLSAKGIGQLASRLPSGSRTQHRKKPLGTCTDTGTVLFCMRHCLLAVTRRLLTHYAHMWVLLSARRSARATRQGPKC